MQYDILFYFLVLKSFVFSLLLISSLLLHVFLFIAEFSVEGSYRLFVTGFFYRLFVTGYLLPAFCYRLFITGFLLPVICYRLLLPKRPSTFDLKSLSKLHIMGDLHSRLLQILLKALSLCLCY